MISTMIPSAEPHLHPNRKEVRVRSDSRRPAGDIFWGTSGPRDAKIAIVGEAWGREEEERKEPFVGESGKEFQRIFSEAGHDWASAFKTNCMSVRPPDNDASLLFLDNHVARTIGADKWKGLYPHEPTKSEITRMWQQLEAVRPKIVIASGNYALWALTERCSVSSVSLGNGATVLVPSGIMSWRGSMIYSESTPFPSTPVLPIIHPAAILRAWYNRAVTVHDLSERVPQALKDDWRSKTKTRTLAPPSFEEACHWLNEWLRILNKRPIRLVADIETNRQFVICIGFADSASFAMVVPFVRLEPDGSFSSFWSQDQETALIKLIRRLFLHRNLRLEGQNFIYDTQYIRHHWGVTPRLDFDTMLAHHLLFPGTPKGLDYLSSLYCRHHWYWKDDGKEWNTRHQGLLQLLAYNAVDCIRTFECATVLREQISKNGLDEQWEWEKRKAHLALEMMIRGINVDRTRRASVGFELLTALQAIHLELEQIAPRDIAREAVPSSNKPWFSSPKQTLYLLHEVLGLPTVNHKKTGNPTVDDEALTTLRKKRPEFSKLFSLLASERSIDVFSSTFLRAPLDSDGRMRCSFNPAGTETFRWSSSTNAFGGGTNLQNIPKGTED
jgi:uracil-DNA glycosylase